MNHLFTRMLSFALAFGIFFILSCSNLQKTESAASTSKEETNSVEEKISAVNEQISEEPGNSDLQVRKAELLYQYSETIELPSSRTPVYQNIKDIADSYPSDQLDRILSEAWHFEKQSGIRLLQEEPSGQTQEYSDIIGHFENAITLIPDSLQTYSLLATTYYQHGNLQQAIETLEKADQQEDLYQPSVNEKLAYLYLESGDLIKAEERYSELVEFDPGKPLYKHGLINVLILSDKHQEAIELLEQLSSEYPTRYTYQESLATELYYLFKNKTDALISSGINDELSDTEHEELVTILQSVHSIFETIQESLPTSEENLFRMASFYKNASNRISEIPEPETELKELEQEFMEYSLPLWERLTEITTENLVYISNLHQVYLDLGMIEEAESIKRTYSF